LASSGAVPAGAPSSLASSSPVAAAVAPDAPRSAAASRSLASTSPVPLGGPSSAATSSPRASNPAADIAVTYVKPHGAPCHDATRDPKLAAIVATATRALPGTAALIGPPRGELAVAATLRGVRYLREGFADRRMRPDGTLVPRTEPDALITSPIE